MKTLQNLTNRQFSDRTVIIGDKAISVIAMITAFAILVLPFVLMIARLA